jgi:hypothetical protein
MLATIWAAIMASKTAKMGSGIVAGGGTMMFILNMFGARFETIEKRIEENRTEARAEMRHYVDFKNNAVLIQLRFMNSRQIDMNETLKEMDRRMYNERKHSKGE